MTPPTDTPLRLSRGTSTAPLAPVRIVHIGLGAFHRAHQAWYTDVVDTDRSWGIAAFTGRTPDTATTLTRQDGLFTVIERSATSDTALVVGSVVEAQPGSNIDRLIELIAAPTTAIITITITEAGYRLLPDGTPNFDDPEVAADLSVLATGTGTPTTALARILAGLAARRAVNAGHLAIVPCDNMPDNGPFVRRGLVALADTFDPSLARWISDTISLVSTSVDRITPKTTPDDLTTAEQLTGFTDDAAVITEPFHDWILSGEFPAGRPDWEDAGARFVTNIEPYERRKLWLLNGAHSLLAYVGRLRGCQTVSDAITDPECRVWVNEFWDEACENLPHGLDLDAYRTALLDRFDNARIVHRLAQIGQDGVTKLRVRIVPTLFAERAAGRNASASIRPIAAWITLIQQGEDLPDSASTAVTAALTTEIDTVAALLNLIDSRLTTDATLLADIRRAVSRNDSLPQHPDPARNHVAPAGSIRQERTHS